MKYVPGPMVGLLSRSQGNTTAARNRGGAYIRNRVVPVNPNTDKQTVQRELLASLSSSWRDLTQAEREAWIALGLQMTRRDTLGQEYTLTGLQAYTSVNRNLILIGDDPTPTAPALDMPPDLTDVDVASLTAAAFTIDWTAALDGDWIVFEATAPVSPGRSFFPRSEYKLVQINDDTAEPPTTIHAAYLSIFGARAVGTKIGVRVRLISGAGFAGPAVLTSGIVAA